ncbi:hypothetical protein L6164_018526 [Bauhinia variegata]|uniref:Uncharacterized protein n=1 Tax=Bauhinia variegata TaxID=167791 RepID=A0ACB9NBK1_BAUVA|nr:hypothetical protein L6164_018526 [Bauhinia variegata]
MVCELCEKRAAMYCESDRAKLCWGCDEKVHGANFLVAKHSRILLCRACRSPTPWKACGPKLTPTTSICQRCFTNPAGKCDQANGDDERGGDRDREDDSDGGYRSSDENSGNDYDDDDFDDDDDEEDEGENQVVPWSSASSPPPASGSSTNSDGEGDMPSSIGGGALPLKRLRENYLVDSDDENEIGRSSSGIPSAALSNNGTAYMRVLRPLKQPHRW